MPKKTRGPNWKPPSYTQPVRYQYTLPYGYVTVRQAAEILGVHPSTLSGWVRRLRLKFLYRYFRVSLTHRINIRYKILPKTTVLILGDYLFGQTFRRIGRLTKRPIPPLCQQLYETATRGVPYTIPPPTSSRSTTSASTGRGTTRTSSRPQATPEQPPRPTPSPPRSRTAT